MIAPTAQAMKVRPDFIDVGSAIFREDYSYSDLAGAATMFGMIRDAFMVIFIAIAAVGAAELMVRALWVLL
jgi:hypothetical protein